MLIPTCSCSPGSHVCLTAPVKVDSSRTTGPNRTRQVSIESWRLGEFSDDNRKAWGTLVEVPIQFLLLFSCFDLLLLIYHSFISPFYVSSTPLFTSYCLWPPIGPSTFIYTIYSYCTVPYIRGWLCTQLKTSHLQRIVECKCIQVAKMPSTFQTTSLLSSK